MEQLHTMISALPVLPPALIMFVGALLVLISKGIIRDACVLITPILTLGAVWLVPSDASMVITLAGFDLQLLSPGAYSHIFANVFAIAAFAGGLYSLRGAKGYELSAAYLYAGSALGVVYSGDMISFFLFWEMMLIGSLIVIWSSAEKGAKSAGLRYTYLHVLGGVLLMTGIIIQIAMSGSADLPKLNVSVESVIAMDVTALTMESVAMWLIFLGILVNLAGPIFSSWVPDTYPEASPYGAVFLSAFTTKTAVFAMLTMAAGSSLLIFLGLIMIFYGIIYAMLENDMRRILSYSIVNQVGFMTVGIGIGTPLALAGVATHAFCHIIYKALLFMSAGAVLKQTEKRKCTDLGGLWKYMPYTAFCAIIGAMSISAFPYTSGFVSKSLISSASAQVHLSGVWLLLLAASAGVFLHAGVKFPWFVFYNKKDNPIKPNEAPWTMRIAMTLMVALCLLPGIFPQYLYMLLPEMPEYEPYTPEHIVTQLQLLLFAGLAFFMALPWLKRTNTISLDVDWLYRVLVKHMLLLIEKLIGHVGEFFVRLEEQVVAKLHYRILRLHGPSGILSGHWLIGTTTLLLAGLLALFLLYYYIRG